VLAIAVGIISPSSSPGSKNDLPRRGVADVQSEGGQDWKAK
jgi:hypothetical protein